VTELPSGTVTFLFTDIEGSTALLKQLGDGYAEVLDDHRRLLRETFAAQGGREIDTQGDSFFYAFARAKSAIVAAIDAQRALAAHQWPDGAEVRVRMGLHSGEPLVGEDRYVGIGVNRAARVGAAAHGGQVLVSDATRALVEDDLPEGVFLRDLGTYRLKDIDRPERVSQVVAEGLRVDFPALRGAEPVKKPPLRRRSMLAAALVGVIAAAVAIPVFALGGGSGGSSASAALESDSVGALDASNGRVLAVSSIGTTPGSVAVGEGSVWVANPESDSVSRIDLKTHTLGQTIPVGLSPSGVAVGGGFVWVANGLSGTVSKIDPNANGGSVIDTIPVGNGPSGLVFAGRRLWVANSTDRTVMEFAPGSHRPLKTIGVAAGADAITSGFGFVWVVSGAGDSVTRIALDSGTALPAITVGNNPTAIATGADSVWVANSLDGTVSRIDPTTGTVSGIAVGGSPSGIAAGSSDVWVSDARAGTLSRIDPTGGKVVQTISTSNRAGSLASSGRELYAAVSPSGLAHRGGTVTVYPSGPFDSIDPAASYTVQSWSAMILTYDGLVGFQRVGGSDGTRIVPDLATSLPTISDGGRTYVFQVRDSIHYSTGALVQPADFRRAIERSLLTSSGTGFYFSGILGAGACVRKPKRCDLSKGIVVDPVARTITFHLTAPDADFLDKLALPSAYAVPADTPVKARPPLPATGPYMIASYDAKHGVTLVRNPHFREWSPPVQPAGYPDKIVFTLGGSYASHLNAVEQGKADFMDEALGSGDAIGVATRLRQEGYGSQLHVNPAAATFFVFLNTRLPPFNDVRVRQAVNYAVDRNRMVALQGKLTLGRPGCQVLPPNYPGYARYCPYPHDLAKAKQLVAASRTQGEQVTFWSVDIRKPSNDYFVSVLQSLGYKVRLKLVPYNRTPASANNYYAAVADSRNKVQAAPDGFGADYPGSSNLISLLTCASFKPATGTNLNLAEFCNRSIDKQINRALAIQTTDPQAAATLWERIDHEIVDQAPWVVYGNPDQADFVSKRIHNYEYNPQWGALLDQLWVR
jgi:YVTN family beta-propeller protein